MQIEIEKNVPIPPRGKEGNSKYPWKQMNVGDSFLVEAEEAEPYPVLRERVSKATMYASRKGLKFCTRKAEGGIRVWRIA